MSYTKTTWANGDIITAEKLNHMEDGIENAGGGNTFFLTQTYDEATDETYWLANEVYDQDKTYTNLYVVDNEGRYISGLTPITSGFSNIKVEPFSNPNVYIDAYSHDANDDTLLKYNRASFVGSITLTEDD